MTKPIKNDPMAKIKALQKASLARVKARAEAWISKHPKK